MGTLAGTARLAMVACASWLLLPPRPARASSPSRDLTVSVTCDEPASIGRVRCEAHAVAEGVRITWGDVIVVRAPPFVRVLRGRIGPSDATEKTAASWRWAFGLVAADHGAGPLEVRVRVVACDAAGACSAREATTRAELVVR